MWDSVALPFGDQQKPGSNYFSMLANFWTLNFMLTVQEEPKTSMDGVIKNNVIEKRGLGFCLNPFSRLWCGIRHQSPFKKVDNLKRF